MIPQINSFTATLGAIGGSGQTCNLAWSVAGASTVSINGQTVSGSSLNLTVAANTSYVLTASNVAGTNTATILIPHTPTLATPAWKRNVIYLGNEPIAEVDGAGIHELHKDHLGTPRIITNGSTGKIEGRQTYGPYGERILNTAADNTYKEPLIGYTGHIQTDATGLIYMRGRFFSPAWHRFLNSDHGADANSPNQFAYVNGSPFHMTDPSGMVGEGGSCFNTWVLPFWEFYDNNGMPRREYGMPYIRDTFCLNSGNSGGGGGGSSAPSPEEQGEKKNQSDCEKYVESVVANIAKFKNLGTRTWKGQLGSDLYNRGTSDISLSSFGLQNSVRGNHTTGFKQELVAWGQNWGVYRHVTTTMGAVLKWGAMAYVVRQAEDLKEYYSESEDSMRRYENIADMNGNTAGYKMAIALAEPISAEELKTLYKDILCQN